MKKILMSAALIASFSLVSVASAQSTVTGTLSSGGTTATTSSGTTVTGTVGSGNSLTGTVTATSTTASGSTGTSGGGGGGGNGPIVGGGGGGGPDTTVICPNLPNSLYTLPSGYEIVDGDCDPIGTVVTTGTGSGTTGTTAPGIPNTGAGGDAAENDLVLVFSGLLGSTAGIALLRRQFSR